MTPRDAQRGYALILTLWTVMLLSLICSSYVLTARAESHAVASTLRVSQARSAAEAAVWLAIGSRLEVGGRRREDAASLSQMLSFGGADVTVDMRDISGLVNINRAQADLIQAVLSDAGLEPHSAASVAERILDWRDEDRDARAGGREPVTYETSWGSVTVRNGRFRTIDELRAIPGVSDAAFRAFREHITVYGDHSRINLDAARPELIAALSDGSGQVNRRWVQGAIEGIYSLSSTATLGDVAVELTPIIRMPRGPGEELAVLSWNGDGVHH